MASDRVLQADSYPTTHQQSQLHLDFLKECMWVALYGKKNLYFSPLILQQKQATFYQGFTGFLAQHLTWKSFQEGPPSQS